VARAERSGAGAFLLEPPGGSEGRQGAAAVRARCRADGEPERRLAPHPSARRGQSSRAASVWAWLPWPVRWPLRWLVYRSVRSCASLWWPGHRGGTASAACLMAQPWTTVGPRDHTTLPPQRRTDRSADCGTARCLWETARTRAPAGGCRIAPAAGSAGEDSPQRWW